MDNMIYKQVLKYLLSVYINYALQILSVNINEYP